MPLIGFDYTAALRQSAGIGRYARELAAALAATGEVRLALFAADARRADLPPAPPNSTWRPSTLSERTFSRLWGRLNLPIPVELWTGRVELFHAADFTLPHTLPGTPTLVTIHDLAFERHPDDTMPGMLRYLKTVAPRSARRADAVIAVSEATGRDLVELYGLPPRKIHVVPHGVSARFTPINEPSDEAIRLRYRLPDGPFILTVGTLQPRKNHLRLVRALARLQREARLVIAGGDGWAYEPVRAEVARLGLMDRVTFAGFAGEADLPGLYRLATVFAYPALYEGFGMPVLEAMASGTPVVTSTVSSLPEAAGEAALLVDPLDETAIARALEQTLGDEMLRARLVEKGLARAAEFSWERAARRTLEVYRAVL